MDDIDTYNKGTGFFLYITEQNRGNGTREGANEHKLGATDKNEKEEKDILEQ